MGLLKHQWLKNMISDDREIIENSIPKVVSPKPDDYDSEEEEDWDIAISKEEEKQQNKFGSNNNTKLLGKHIAHSTMKQPGLSSKTPPVSKPAAGAAKKKLTLDDDDEDAFANFDDDEENSIPLPSSTGTLASALKKPTGNDIHLFTEQPRVITISTA